MSEVHILPRADWLELVLVCDAALLAKTSRWPASSCRTFSDYHPGREQHPAPPTDFGTAQLEEPNFAQALEVSRSGGRCTTRGGEFTNLPILCCRNGLLYSMCQVHSCILPTHTCSGPTLGWRRLTKEC